MWRKRLCRQAADDIIAYSVLAIVFVNAFRDLPRIAR